MNTTYRKGVKRFFAIVIAMAILFSTMPAAAFAEEGSHDYVPFVEAREETPPPEESQEPDAVSEPELPGNEAYGEDENPEPTETYTYAGPEDYEYNYGVGANAGASSGPHYVGYDCEYCEDIGCPECYVVGYDCEYCEDIGCPECEEEYLPLPTGLNFAGLRAALSAAAAVDQDLYTPESLEALAAAVAAGESLLDNLYAEQEAIDYAAEAIHDAIDALELVATEPVAVRENTLTIQAEYEEPAGIASALGRMFAPLWGNITDPLPNDLAVELRRVSDGEILYETTTIDGEAELDISEVDENGYYQIWVTGYAHNWVVAGNEWIVSGFWHYRAVRGADLLDGSLDPLKITLRELAAGELVTVNFNPQLNTAASPPSLWGPYRGEISFEIFPKDADGNAVEGSGLPATVLANGHRQFQVPRGMEFVLRVQSQNPNHVLSTVLSDPFVTTRYRGSFQAGYGDNWVHEFDFTPGALQVPSTTVAVQFFNMLIDVEITREFAYGVPSVDAAERLWIGLLDANTVDAEIIWQEVINPNGTAVFENMQRFDATPVNGTLYRTPSNRAYDIFIYASSTLRPDAGWVSTPPGRSAPEMIPGHNLHQRSRRLNVIGHNIHPTLADTVMLFANPIVLDSTAALNGQPQPTAVGGNRFIWDAQKSVTSQIPVNIGQNPENRQFSVDYEVTFTQTGFDFLAQPVLILREALISVAFSENAAVGENYVVGRLFFYNADTNTRVGDVETRGFRNTGLLLTDNEGQNTAGDFIKILEMSDVIEAPHTAGNYRIEFVGYFVYNRTGTPTLGLYVNSDGQLVGTPGGETSVRNIHLVDNFVVTPYDLVYDDGAPNDFFIALSDTITVPEFVRVHSVDNFTLRGAPHSFGLTPQLPTTRGTNVVISTAYFMGSVNETITITYTVVFEDYSHLRDFRGSEGYNIGNAATVRGRETGMTDTDTATVRVNTIPRFDVIFAPGNGGDWNADNETFRDVYRDSATPHPSFGLVNPPALDGWEFAGWTPLLSTTVTRDVTYTATWTEDHTQTVDMTVYVYHYTQPTAMANTERTRNGVRDEITVQAWAGAPDVATVTAGNITLRTIPGFTHNRFEPGLPAPVTRDNNVVRVIYVEDRDQTVDMTVYVYHYTQPTATANTERTRNGLRDEITVQAWAGAPDVATVTAGNITLRTIPGFTYNRVEPGLPAQVTRDNNVVRVIYIARTDITVSFNSQGGAPQNIPSRNVTFGAPYGELPANPTRAGFIFEGWWTHPAPNGTLVTAATLVTNSDDHTLYAHWRVNLEDTVTVYITVRHYTADPDGTNRVLYAEETIPVQVWAAVPEEPNVTADDITPLLRTIPGFTYYDFEPNLSVTPPVVSVIYRANVYNITYQLNSGTNHNHNPSTYTIRDTPITIHPPTRAGYTFLGWTSVQLGISGVQNAIIPASKTGDLTLVAAWEENPDERFTVTFVDHDDAVLAIRTNVIYGTDATPPADPTRVGYLFDGWDGYYTNVTNDRTITATYRINPDERFTVTFVDHDDAVLAIRTNVIYGTDATPPADPTRVGWTFTGWDGYYTNVTEDLTITAQYDFYAAEGLTFSVTGNSTSVTFDGAQHTASGFTYVIYDVDGYEIDLPGGFTVTADTSDPSSTNVANLPNIVSNVRIFFNNDDVTDFVLAEDITTTDGSLAIAQRPITITAGSTSRVFNNQPLTNNTATITEGTLVDGHNLYSVTVSGTQTAVGSSYNVASAAVIQDAEGNDVTANYVITFADGILTITAAGGNGGGSNGGGGNGGGGNGGGPTPILPTTPVTEIDDPAVPLAAAPVTPPAPPVDTLDLVEIDDPAVPLATAPTLPVDESAPMELMEIDDPAVPLAALPVDESSWSLVNLLLTILGGLAAIAIAAVVLIRRKDQEKSAPQRDERRYRRSWIGAIVLAIAGVIVFALTQDLRTPMAFVDNWTIVHAVLVAVEAVAIWATFKRKKDGGSGNAGSRDTEVDINDLHIKEEVHA